MSFEQARGEAVSLIGDRERLQLLEHDLKFLRDLRDVLLNKIASVDLRQDHGDIRTAVVSEPTLPKSPVWPKLSLVVACCLALGLGSGLGLIYVLDILDDRFRSPDELRGQLGVPVLAMVRQMDDLNAVGLDNIHVHVEPEAAASESFRTLRTTLAFSGQETSRLVVSSAEPGDGKTTVLANLAVSFQQAGKRTLLVDADMRRPGLTAQMGLKGRPGLSDFLLSDDGVAQAAAANIQTLAVGLDFIPAGGRRPNPAELLSGPRFAGTAGLGRSALRPDPDRQSAVAGGHRLGDHRSSGGRRGAGRSTQEESPPAGDPRRGILCHGRRQFAGSRGEPRWRRQGGQRVRLRSRFGLWIRSGLWSGSRRCSVRRGKFYAGHATGGGNGPAGCGRHRAASRGVIQRATMRHGRNRRFA